MKTIFSSLILCCTIGPGSALPAEAEDRVAVVWTPYDLFIDEEFSHCGIDNFNFLKIDDGWKITGIVFSMKQDDCPESPLGPLQQ